MKIADARSIDILDNILGQPVLFTNLEIILF